MVNLVRFLSRFNNILIVCHPNADPDCIGSAYAVLTALNALYPEKHVTILATEGIGSSSKKMIDYLHLSSDISTRPPKTTSASENKNKNKKMNKNDALFLLVDTSSIDQVPVVKNLVESKGIPYAIVDHHTPVEKTVRNAAFSLIKERSSACEVVFEALGSRKLQPKALEALLTGLIYDSRRFLNRPESSILFASKLIRLGATPSLAIELLSSDDDPSERMAKLKGASRIKMYKADDWIISVTSIGSFESSVARAITTLGADVSLVLNCGKSGSRLSGRASDAFFKKTGFNLACDLMQPLAGIFGGQGGGHPTAASVNLKRGSGGEIVPKTLELLAVKISPKSKLKEITVKKD